MSESAFEKVIKIKEKVELILIWFPEARNSDEFLREKLEKLYPKIKFNPETVGRVRRKFQEEGKYLPTNPEVAKLRRRYSDEMREKMPKTYL
ncbi:MAG: hypothetical protein QXV17_07795 [Candidatus Micrarchaeaceae archaeon]